MKLEIARYLVPDFEAKINKANRRLKRAGSEARFTAEYRNFTDSGVDNLGNEYTVPMCSITLNSLKLTIGDWEFVARVEWEEAGPVVYCAPGYELLGWRPDQMHCDHCGTSRNRTKMYVVKQGKELRLLGSNCLELYTGIKPRGLWALEYADELTQGWETDSYNNPRTERKAYLNSVIALAWAISDQGRRYVSVKQSQESLKPSTSDTVRRALWSPRHLLTGEEWDGIFAQAQEYLADEELIEKIIDSADEVRASSDYGQNLRTFVNCDWLNPRGVGIVTSLVTVYARQQEQLATRPVTPGFIGEPGDKLKDVRLTLSTVRAWEGKYGITTLVVGATADGHVVKWFAAKALDVKPGQVMKIKSCAVKECEQFKGVDQTVITRARVAA